jgi:hypothetical protein
VALALEQAPDLLPQLGIVVDDQDVEGRSIRCMRASSENARAITRGSPPVSSPAVRGWWRMPTSANRAPCAEHCTASSVLIIAPVVCSSKRRRMLARISLKPQSTSRTGSANSARISRFQALAEKRRSSVS